MPETICTRIELMQANRFGMVVDASTYERGMRTTEQETAIEVARQEILDMPGELYVANPIPSDRSPAAMVDLAKAKGCDLLIIDQLQFVRMPERRSLTESIGAGLQDLKQAISSPTDGRKIAVLMLHQMNRTGVKAQQQGVSKVGSMADISNSAWVEQISDVVWALGRTREEQLNDIMNLATLKVRSIAPAGWRLFWDASSSYQFYILEDEHGRPDKLEEWT